jgi:anti-sigma factor RsiW
MTHTDYTVWMSLALDGLLTPEEERSLHAHMAVCAGCYATWKGWCAVDQRLAVAAAEPLLAPATGFAGRVDARLRAQQLRQRGTISGLLFMAGSIALWMFLSLSAIAVTAWWLAHRPSLLVGLLNVAAAFLSTVSAVMSGMRLFWGSLIAPPMQPVIIAYLAVMLLLAIVWTRLVTRQDRQASTLPATL